MKVADIEVHEIGLEYQDALAYEFSHYYHISGRTVYVVHTDTGLVGLGEGDMTEPQEVLDRYIGSNPFDWIGDETSLGLGTAMYDLMGKAAGVPVYKLFGQRYRAWVAGVELDGVHAPGADGRSSRVLCGPRLYVAEVPPLTLGECHRADRGDAASRPGGVPGALRLHHAGDR